MATTIILLALLAATAVVVAAYAVLGERARREVVGRARDGGDFSDVSRAVLIAPTDDLSLGQRIASMLPSAEGNSITRDRLTYAGYDSAYAVPVYNAVRLVVVTGFTLVAVIFAPKESFGQWALMVLLGAIVGVIVPMYWLVRAVRLRQTRILKGLPDAMDLLVLCVEAGLGFDAAMLRVAKDMRLVHGDLAQELMLVNRKVNTGITRDEALRAMYARTGVEELRVLVQNLIQADRLGTSVAKVLRVYADTLRRKRRQRAERRAATAALRMTFPLAVLILPALFVVILGPAMLRIFGWFANR